jgi:hypothetical protein
MIVNLALVGHSEKTFNRLSPEQQALVADLTVAMESAGQRDVYTAKHIIWNVLAKNRITFPSDMLAQIEEDDSLEMWSSDRNFIFGIGNIMDGSDYSQAELTEKSWEQLFHRDPFAEAQIIASFEKALMTKETQYNVTDWHNVIESKEGSRNSIKVKVIQISPFHKGDLTGVFAVVKTQRSASF